MQPTVHPIFDYLNPVAFHLGSFAVHWYGIAYALGALLGYWLILRIDRTEKMLPEKVKQDLMTWCMLGVIIGGRVGYVLVYKLYNFLHDPIYLFKIWQGGMSFHGGMVGLALALLVLARKNKTPFLPLMDRVALVAPIGIFLARLANFVNAELYGRVTTSCWGITFPGTGPFPRHPSQIYEAMGEGLLLGLLLAYWFFWRGKQRLPGATAALFLVGYGSIRLLLENFREPDAHLGYYFFNYTMGQLLCVPMIILGAWLLVRSYRLAK